VYDFNMISSNGDKRRSATQLHVDR
jgi:hypothetical protein